MVRKYINMALDPVKSKHITEEIKDFFLKILDNLGIDYDADYYELDDNGVDASKAMEEGIKDNLATRSKKKIDSAFKEFKDNMDNLKSVYEVNKTTNTTKSKSGGGKRKSKRKQSRKSKKRKSKRKKSKKSHKRSKTRRRR